MAKAKEDHTERVNKATAIKADIAKTLDAVIDANNVLQVFFFYIKHHKHGTVDITTIYFVRSSLMMTPKFS